MDTTIVSTTRSYDELLEYPTFEDRFAYLRLHGVVGSSTFGFDRWVNQRFYRSREWKTVRDFVMVRDNGCDLGIPGREVYDTILVHHMNPISLEDVVNHEDWILDPNFLITTCHRTHNAIHYSDISLLPPTTVERAPGDTRLW